MMPATLAPLANHLWQSTLFAAAAGGLTIALRANQARTRYWLWLAASLKFLVPFSLLTGLGGHFGWLPRNHAAAPPVFPVVIEEIGQPFGQVAFPAPLPAAPVHDFMPALPAALWLVGCTAVVFVWWRRWRRVAAILRQAKPMIDGREFALLRRHPEGARVELRSTESALEPGVFGVFRPALLWPAGISARLADEQIEAIIAHELCHVRRRDNLAAALHMAVEAAFWFHPLVWWLGTRLVEERERACDEEVLRLGSEPEVYAESLLKTCRFCLESPLLCTSGVLGSSIAKRIEGIMTHRVGSGLDFGRKLMLASAAIAAVAGPIVIGIVNAPRIEAQSRLTFDAATIKPSQNPGPAAPVSIRIAPGGRLTAMNTTLRMLVNYAYNVRDAQISGGPSWIDSDRFDIEAKPENTATPDQLRLMLQSLLADRFTLKIHKDSKEMNVYALTVAKGDPKLEQSERPGDVPSIHMAPGAVTAQGATMAQLVSPLSIFTGRTVVDKTGLPGKYDFELKWTPDGSDGDLPSIFTAVEEQLGLKLEPQKGPVDVIVIDRAGKPSEN